MKNLQEEGNEI